MAIMPIVSVFDATINPNPYSATEFNEVAHAVVHSNNVANATFQYRELQGDAAKEFKLKQMPAFTAAGEFTRRANADLVNHSGLCVLDFDAKDNPTLAMGNAAQMRNLAQDVHHTLLAFISPSGGVKVVVALDPIPTAETHKYAYAYAAARYSEWLNLQIDYAADVARACVISHDPQARLDWEVEPLKWEMPERKDAPVKGWRNQADVDWGAIALDVVRKLRPDAREQRANGQSRFGNHGSLSVTEWGGISDFENGYHGGVLGFVMAELNLAKSAALEWLEGGGFMPKRKGAGRPKGGNSATAAAISEGAALEDHQRFGNAEASDLARIQTYCRDRILEWKGNGLVFARGAYWERFSLRGLAETEGFIRKIGLEARAKAVKDLPEGMAEYGALMLESLPDNANHWQQVTRLVRGLDNWDDFGEPHDYTARPLLPMADGVWDVRGGHKITAEAARKFRMMMPTELMPEPDMDILGTDYGKRIAAIWIRHYGAPLTQRLAYSLLGPTKRIESVKAQATGFGKSAIGRLMKRAFGAGIADVEEHEQIGKRFSLLDRKMTEVKMLFVDDVNEVKGLAVKPVTRLTADELTVEGKGMDSIRLPRQGTVWFLGNDWAQVDMSEGALKARLGWAHDYGNQAALPRADAKELHKRGAEKVIQALVLDYAKALPEGDAWDIEGDMNAKPNDVALLKAARGG